MRVWIIVLSFLLWTACDSVRYGSVPCEGDECGDISEIESSDSKDSLSSENPRKDNKSSSSSVNGSSQREHRHRSSSSKGSGKDTSEVQNPIIDTTITGTFTCHDGVLVPAEAAEETEDEAADFRRAGVAISGFAEKGPFRYGTSVKIVELDSVKRLADSGRSHETCIVATDGSFNFANINLVSPYVRVEANGFYVDELTGGVSSSLIKLNAVVDLSKRDSFNVNMLTHMAAPRVRKLVEDSGNNQPIGSQSGRALSDVLSSFGIRAGIAVDRRQRRASPQKI